MKLKGLFADKSAGVQLLIFIGIFAVVTIVTLLLTTLLTVVLHVDMQARAPMLVMQAVSSLLMWGGSAAIATYLFTCDSVFVYWKNNSVTFQWLLLGVIIFAFSMPTISLLAGWNEQLHLPESLAKLEELMVKSEEAAREATELLTGGSGVGLFLVELIVIAAIPALVEELFFRGVMQNLMYRSTSNTHIAVWSTAVVFSLLHFQFFGFVPRMVMGAILGYLYHYGRSLWINTTAHFFNNAIALSAYWIAARVESLKDIQSENLSVSVETVSASVLSLSIAVVLLWVMKREIEEREKAD
ncbi:MAG: CPBP family intramembrane metalloprotease [Paludibacteraceae bacterium]|nr:CPBP family intramembrane metalloprotease [Paludibacteraceae bacterium]